MGLNYRLLRSRILNSYAPLLPFSPFPPILSPPLLTPPLPLPPPPPPPPPPPLPPPPPPPPPPSPHLSPRLPPPSRLGKGRGGEISSGEVFQRDRQIHTRVERA